MHPLGWLVSFTGQRVLMVNVLNYADNIDLTLDAKSCAAAVAP